MAQFLGKIIGRRGKATTRLGDKSSGLVVECNGWTDGIRVEADCKYGSDRFTVYRTHGSSGGTKELIGTYGTLQPQEATK